MFRYYSHGKLLLTGEYAVLEGAKALAIPCKFGQDLRITPNATQQLEWKSFTVEGEVWFAADFTIQQIQAEPLAAANNDSDRLLRILQIAHQMRPEFWKSGMGYCVKAHLEFPRDWGLGSSSTLIANIAQWLDIDAYQLLKATFGGSGYDLACAVNDMPIIYQLAIQQARVQKVFWYPQWLSNTFFVHLNRKQNSRESIAHFKKQHAEIPTEFVETISQLTDDLLHAHSLEEAQVVLYQHEEVISNALDMPRIQQLLFPDFNGVIKSLGGWGGDFVWVLGDGNSPDYFRSKGYSTIIGYDEMLLK